MRAFAYPTRKRSRDKGRLENRVKNPKQCVVQHPIAYRRLVNVTRLRIADTEADVLTMLVCFVHQIPVQPKDILFKIFLEVEHIDFLLLAALEFIPRRKQSFGISNFAK